MQSEEAFLTYRLSVLLLQLAADHTLCSHSLFMSEMDRTFSSWRHGGLGNKKVASTADFNRLETSILETLRRAAGYPDPKDGGEFDPNKLTSAYLNKLDTNKKLKLIGDMAGLLWYRSLPLTRLARKQLEEKKEDKKPVISSGANDSKDSMEVDYQVLDDLRTTRDRLDATKDELLERDRKIITLQDEVSALKDSIISMKDSLLEKSMSAVQTVVKEEIKSYSTVLETAATAVKESCASALAPSKIRTAIASASEDRTNNLIVYGLAETSDSNDHDKIKDLFQELGEAPVVSKVERLGKSASDEHVRPVRVMMRTREAARTVLGKSAQLKDSDSYETVYIAPDRTVEERAERRVLVARLRERRKSEPEKIWRIRRGLVVASETEEE